MNFFLKMLMYLNWNWNVLLILFAKDNRPVTTGLEIRKLWLFENVSCIYYESINSE